MEKVGQLEQLNWNEKDAQERKEREKYANTLANIFTDVDKLLCSS